MEAAEEEVHRDEIGDGNTGGNEVDYDNTSDDYHTRDDNHTRGDIRVDDANRYNVREERENRNQGPVKKAAQAPGLDNCLMNPLTHRVEGPPMRSSGLKMPLQINTSSNIWFSFFTSNL